MILYRMMSLQKTCKLIIFYLLLFYCSCKSSESNSGKASVIWKDDHAVGVSIPKDVIENLPPDSVQQYVQVRIAKHDEPAIAGTYRLTTTELIFEPIIPFTRGMSFEVFVRNHLVDHFNIEALSGATKLLAIYPRVDTVPENLLKIYLLFSHPMTEDHALDYVSLANEHGNSLPQSFLNLRQELWNDDRTILTLWLDPGRIKRGLHPNKLFGPPLQKGNRYQIIVARNWPDQQGRLLERQYVKKILVAGRDTISPTVKDWTIIAPHSSTKDSLVLDLHETLDFFLLQHSISCIGPDNRVLRGIVSVSDNGSKFIFKPQDPWIPAHYKFRVESRLEDLAGNNLNRPFERDVSDQKASQTDKAFYEKEFLIH